MHPHISLIFTSVRLKPWIAINVTDHPACVHLKSRCHCLWMKLSTRNCGKAVIHTFEYLISDEACSESFRSVELEQVCLRLRMSVRQIS